MSIKAQGHSVLVRLSNIYRPFFQSPPLGVQIDRTSSVAGPFCSLEVKLQFPVSPYSSGIPRYAAKDTRPSTMDRRLVFEA